MTRNWDDEEAAKDAKTYQTTEGSLKALDHIIKNILEQEKTKGYRHCHSLPHFCFMIGLLFGGLRLLVNCDFFIM